MAETAPRESQHLTLLFVFAESINHTMPCYYQFYREQNFVLERFTGITVREEFEEMVQQIWAEPGWHREFSVMIDFRACSLAYAPEDIRFLCDFFIQSPDSTLGRGAILVRTPYETALGGLLENYLQGHNQAGVFSTWSAASAFLGITLPDPFADHPTSAL